MRTYRIPFLVVIMTISLFFYMYLNPSFTGDSILRVSLPGDIPAYLSRFMLSFIFMGIIPFVSALVLGFSLRDMGLIWSRGIFREKWFWLLFILIILMVFGTAFNDQLSQFYPYSRTLLQMSIDVSPAFFLLHALLYLLLYYLPWELFFRGLMILPLVHSYERIVSTGAAPDMERSRSSPYLPANEGPLNSWKNPALLTLALLQIIPNTIVHLPHPLFESLGSIVTGCIAAVIVLHTRSVLPVIMLHATAGIMLDLFILIRVAAGI